MDDTDKQLKINHPIPLSRNSYTGKGISLPGKDDIISVNADMSKEGPRLGRKEDCTVIEDHHVADERIDTLASNSFVCNMQQSDFVDEAAKNSTNPDDGAEKHIVSSPNVPRASEEESSRRELKLTGEEMKNVNESHDIPASFVSPLPPSASSADSPYNGSVLLNSCPCCTPPRTVPRTRRPILASPSLSTDFEASSPQLARDSTSYADCLEDVCNMTNCPATHKAKLATPTSLRRLEHPQRIPETEYRESRAQEREEIDRQAFSAVDDTKGDHNKGEEDESSIKGCAEARSVTTTDTQRHADNQESTGALKDSDSHEYASKRLLSDVGMQSMTAEKNLRELVLLKTGVITVAEVTVNHVQNHKLIQANDAEISEELLHDVERLLRNGTGARLAVVRETRNDSGADVLQVEKLLERKVREASEAHTPNGKSGMMTGNETERERKL